MPVTENASRTVFEARRELTDILNGADDRLAVVVGPCSIHDPAAAREALAEAGFPEGRGLPPIAEELAHLMDQNPEAQLIIPHGGIAEVLRLRPVRDGDP